MKVYHGNFISSKDKDTFLTLEDSYICVNDEGIIEDILNEKPDGEYEYTDFEDNLVIPGFTDLHLHSSQQVGAGLGYDDYHNWFPTTTLPAEAKYSRNPDYARKLNSKLIWRLWKNGVVNSVITSTDNLEATEDLFEQMKTSGLRSYIGKMNSDHRYFDDPRETTEKSREDTDYLINRYAGEKGLARLIFSPEFIPACSDEIMDYLGKKAKELNIPVTSHLAESGSDVKAVKERYNGTAYSFIYDRFGLLGQVPTVMAHCMNIDEDEIPLLANPGVIVRHCPMSNLDVPGVTLMNMRKLLDAGVKIGFGSDIGGGHTLSVPQNMVCSAQMAKQLHKRLNQDIVTMNEIFWCATKVGGSFFGKSGSFEKGYSFDCNVIDDTVTREDDNYTLEQRLLRYIYCSDECEIKLRYCNGKTVKEPKY